MCNLNQGFGGPYGLPTPTSLVSGCFEPTFGLAGLTSFITDREDVANVHIGIPRKNGQKDDIQILWNGSALRTLAYNSPSSAGPGVAASTIAVSGAPYQAGVNYPRYQDSVVYNLPFGTNVDPNGTALPYSLYLQPNSPTNRAFQAQLPSNADDLYNNDTGIVKLQLTHPISEGAYIRLYGYSFFSDWTEDGENMSAYSYFSGTNQAPYSPNYNLITHTTGGQLQFADQFNDQNLLTFTANYTQANTSRLNNTGFLSYGFAPTFAQLFGLTCTPNNPLTPDCRAVNGFASSPIGYISEAGGVYYVLESVHGQSDSVLRRRI